jgi:hypothetical protein
MGGEFRQGASGQAPKGVGMIDFEMELLGQLPVDGLEKLAEVVVALAVGGARLRALMVSGQGQLADLALSL